MAMHDNTSQHMTFGPASFSAAALARLRKLVVAEGAADVGRRLGVSRGVVERALASLPVQSTSRLVMLAALDRLESAR